MFTPLHHFGVMITEKTKQKPQCSGLERGSTTALSTEPQGHVTPDWAMLTATGEGASPQTPKWDTIPPTPKQRVMAFSPSLWGSLPLGMQPFQAGTGDQQGHPNSPYTLGLGLAFLGQLP